MKWLVLNPDTIIGDTYYTEHELNYARNVLSENTKQYCDKWGYDYIRDSQVHEEIKSLIKEGRTGWTLSTCNKILQLKKHLSNYDYVCVLDTYDILITNHNIPLTNFINETDYMFIGEDVYHPETPIFMERINSGWMIFKNDPSSFKLLDNYIKCLFSEDFPYDEFNDQNMLICAVNKLEDIDKKRINHADKIKQSYWIYNGPSQYELLNNDYTRMKKLMNSKYLWKHGDFLIHMCGHINRFQLLEIFYDLLYRRDRPSI